MEETVNTIELPLFPLNTVLFPGQVLPLHIFEERYRLLIRRCLAEDSLFGIVLIRRGEEVGDSAEPHPIGTMARIVESTRLPDGTMNIVVVGTERFRIQRLMYDQPYLRGEVTMFPMPQGEPAATVEITMLVREQVKRYIALIAEAAGLQIQIEEIPTGPEQVGYLAAVAMQVDNKEKQALLSSGSLLHILGAELTLLGRENTLLTWMAATRDWPGEAQFGPGGTLLPN